MKNLKRILFSFGLIAIAILGITFIGCQKKIGNTDLSGKSVNYNLAQYANMQNSQFVLLSESEINSIGIMHNELLDKILSDFNYNSLSTNSMFNLCRSSFIYSEFNGATDGFKESTFDQTHEWLNQNEVSENVLNYLNTINSILINNQAVIEISENLNSLKTQVNNDPSLSEIEVQAVKVGISVGLKSAEYWLPIEFGGNGKGYAHILKLSEAQGEGSITLAQARSRGAGIAAADVAGGCTGAIGWCGTAIFGGPVGLAGFIGGTLYSAVTGSLLAWAKVG